MLNFWKPQWSPQKLHANQLVEISSEEQRMRVHSMTLRGTGSPHSEIHPQFGEPYAVMQMAVCVDKEVVEMKAEWWCPHETEQNFCLIGNFLFALTFHLITHLVSGKAPLPSKMFNWLRIPPLHADFLTDPKSQPLPCVSTFAAKPAKPNRKIIPSIQGLRGIAIIAVLLFHLRPADFPDGHLGVDLFFVLSGFLICSLLDGNGVVEVLGWRLFAFRRCRRLVPLYLGLISAVLWSGLLGMLSPLDFGPLVVESFPALGFVANWPKKGVTNYFDESAEIYKFFRHLWSLSTELQFYALAPLLISVLRRFRPFFRPLFCLVLAALSFCAQSRSDGDAAHMFLYCRLWQFLVGFLAKFGRDRFPVAASPSRPLRISAIAAEIGVLAILWNGDELLGMAATRLLLCLIVGVLVGWPVGGTLLSAAPLVRLGDVSYSVYLIHWPLFQWHFYSNSVVAASRYASISLSIISICVGFVAERLNEKFTAKWIGDWKRLLAVTGLLYGLCLAPILVLWTKQFDPLSMDMQLIANAPYDVGAVLQQITNGNVSFVETMSPMQRIHLQRQLNVYGTTHPNCPNSTRYPSLAALSDGADLQYHECRKMGNGTKNIVVVGNSVANGAVVGMEPQFRGRYRSFSLLAAAGCWLFNWRGREISQTERCTLYLDRLYAVLENSQEPIDVIVVVAAYYLPNDDFFDGDFDPTNSQDQYNFQLLQSFYEKMGTLAKDLVFVSQRQHSTFVRAHATTFMRRLYNGEDFSAFRTPITEYHRFVPKLQQMIRSVKCPKCALLDWDRVWCHRVGNVCDSVDERLRLSYFGDVIHPNSFGSQLVGRFVRQRYDEEMRNLNITK